MEKPSTRNKKLMILTTLLKLTVILIS